MKSRELFQFTSVKNLALCNQMHLSLKEAWDYVVWLGKECNRTDTTNMKMADDALRSEYRANIWL